MSFTEPRYHRPVVRIKREGYGGGGGGGGGYGHHKGGPVGPVYTFVKTDYHGNFKWGVRHKVGGGKHH